MTQNEKKDEHSVERPFGIQMLAAQKAPRLKTGVNAGVIGKPVPPGPPGGGLHSDDLRLGSTILT